LWLRHLLRLHGVLQTHMVLRQMNRSVSRHLLRRTVFDTTPPAGHREVETARVLVKTWQQPATVLHSVLQVVVQQGAIAPRLMVCVHLQQQHTMHMRLMQQHHGMLHRSRTRARREEQVQVECVE